MLRYLLLQVMMVPKQQRRVMKEAMEIAVQESLSHPNVVRCGARHMLSSQVQ
jgi:hypothetical protein